MDLEMTKFPSKDAKSNAHELSDFSNRGLSDSSQINPPSFDPVLEKDNNDHTEEQKENELKKLNKMYDSLSVKNSSRVIIM